MVSSGEEGKSINRNQSDFVRLVLNNSGIDILSSLGSGYSGNAWRIGEILQITERAKRGPD